MHCGAFAYHNVKMLTVAIASVLLSQTAVQLQLNPALNSSYKYRMIQTMSQSMGPGMNSKITTNVEMNMLYTAAGKNFNQKTSITSAKATAPKGDMMEKMAAQMEKSMKGVSTTSVMDRQGNILSTKSSGVQGQLGGGLSGLSGMNFPKTPVKPGSTWVTVVDLGKILKDSLPGQAKGTMKITSKLVSISGTTANISMSGTGAMNIPNPGGGAKGAPTNMKLNLGLTGMSAVNAKTGIILNSKSTVRSTMDFGSGKMTQTIVISLTKI